MSYTPRDENGSLPVFKHIGKVKNSRRSPTKITSIELQRRWGCPYIKPQDSY